VSASSDPRTRFTATADAYERSRPEYPSALLDWIVSQARLAPGATVADVGCGTGISTRFLAARGLDVVGIDPNEAMLAKARVAGGARYARGEAAATGLAGASVDLVTVAQAFHWFAVAMALAEFRRVLHPAGCCVAFWNVRDRTPLLDAYAGLLRRHSQEYESRPKPEHALAALRVSPLVREPREATFPHTQALDRQGLLGRAHSSSYVAHGVADRAALDRDLGALFESYQSEGRVELVYRTIALLWRFAA
jgi:SAM-dependent methyltransferase